MGSKMPVPPPGTEEQRGRVCNRVFAVAIVGCLMVIGAIASVSWQLALLVAGLLVLLLSVSMAKEAGNKKPPPKVAGENPDPPPEHLRPEPPDPPPPPPPPRRTR